MDHRTGGPRRRVDIGGCHEGFELPRAGKALLERRPDPDLIDPTDAIVRADAVTICGTDLHILKGDVPEVAGGRILGHLIDGTQAEHVRVPFADTSTYKLPDSVTDEAAARDMPLHLVNALDLASAGHRTHLQGRYNEPYNEPSHAASALLLRHLAAMVADEYPKVSVTTETTDIGAAESLVALGGAGDLVVTGTRGHGGFAGLFYGSVSLKTAVHAHCLAIVVHSRDSPCSHPARPEIVLGLEPGQDEAPIRFAFDSCERLGTRLLVVGAHRHRSPVSVGVGYVMQGLLSDAQTTVGIVPIP